MSTVSFLGPAPHISQLENQVRLLVNHLPVTLCQAREMIAFSYNCENWKTLVDQSKTSYNDKTVAYKGNIQRLIETKWKGDINKLRESHLIPNTVSYALKHNRLDWLYDQELESLHSFAFDSEDQTYSPLNTIVHWADNSILTILSNPRYYNNAFKNHWVYDFRFGVQFYFYLYKFSKNIRIELREFDSFFYLNHISKISHLFTKKWLKALAVGYIDYCKKYLISAGYSGEILIYKVFGEVCIPNPPETRKPSLLELSGIRRELFEYGGEPRKLNPERDDSIFVFSVKF